MKNCQLTIPSVVFAGQGSVEKLSAIIEREAAKHVLIFTDKGIRGLGLSKPAEEICGKYADVTVIEDLTAEPAVSDIERVLAEVKSQRISSSASAAAVYGCGQAGQHHRWRRLHAARFAEGQQHCSQADENRHDADDLRHGLGSYLQRHRGHSGAGIQQGIVNDCMIPDYVILDVNMIAKLPPKIIAATGVDALAHVVECFTSKKATKLSDTYAKEGARKIFHNIRKAYAEADNLEAKAEMMIGAFYGGVAITGSGTTAVHALSYPLGGKYHIAHGVSNAILFAHVMEFNKDACEDRLAELCDAVYPELSGKTVAEKADCIIAEIASIVSETNIPTSLKEFGVKPEDLDFLVEAGSQQTRLLVNNCKELSLDDIRYIYKKVM